MVESVVKKKYEAEGGPLFESYRRNLNLNYFEKKHRVNRVIAICVFLSYFDAN